MMEGLADITLKWKVVDEGGGGGVRVGLVRIYGAG